MTDLSSMAASVGALLKQHNQTIAVSESAAGGLISASLVAVPGASAFYLGGAVVYTRAAQRWLLGVPDSGMSGMRASTEAYATLNARTLRELLGTTWGLSETGASGPTGNSYGDDAGHACLAVSGPIERATTIETSIAAREANMWTFAGAALELLEACIRESS